MMHTGDSVLGTSEYDSYGAVSPRRLTIMRNRNTHTHLHIALEKQYPDRYVLSCLTQA